VSQSILSLIQSWNDRIVISDAHQDQSAVYRFEPALPKACFHPLTTRAGHRLTGFEMSDHVWHRGLWFTIKFINGTNFWEENAPFGVQQSSGQPLCQAVSADQIRIAHSVIWTSQATGDVLRENRILSYRSHTEGYSSIDWMTELHANTDSVLDRTPYTTWGGYGGLSFRGARELHDAGFLLPNGETSASLAGQPHDWVMMHAAVDGGTGMRVSLGMIDHPDNPRSPSPWYCKSGNGFNYMNAAFLFHEPMSLKREQTMRFRYRVVYRDGVWTAKEFGALAKDFRESESAQ